MGKLLSREETIELIHKLLWEVIDEAVEGDRLTEGGTNYGRPRYALIARGAARTYREMRAKDPKLPRLFIDDFREYINHTYDDAQLY